MKQYRGCDIRVKEWGTTIHGKDLRHAMKNLDRDIREKHHVSLEEYLAHPNGGRSKGGNPLRPESDIDPTVVQLLRRRRR
jgi:hypothetical protein